jgi:hypothetical protein
MITGDLEEIPTSQDNGWKSNKNQVKPIGHLKEKEQKETRDSASREAKVSMNELLTS